MKKSRKFLLSILVIFGVISLIWIFRPFSNQETAQEIDLMEFAQEITDSFIGRSYEEQQEIISEGRERGVEITFNSDGSVTLEQNGSISIINSDGSLEFRTTFRGGEKWQAGGNFPINALTQLIPTPNFAILTTVGDEAEFTLMAHNVTLAQIQDYVEQSKRRGFSIDIEERLISGNDEARQRLFGDGLGDYFTFSARDSSGNTLEISYTETTSSALITISRP